MKRCDSSWIGKKFGQWTITDGPIKKSWKSYYLCKCACGFEKLVVAGDLKNGKSTKCRICGSTKHGFSGLRLRNIWRNIKDRCTNPERKDYKRYGGRGITVCREWNSWEVFKAWAIETGYRNDLQIDRIENDKGYFPQNCHWTTPVVNARNRRTNRMITAFGETKCLIEWVEDDRGVVGKQTLKGRLERGWSSEKAITTPPRRKLFMKKLFLSLWIILFLATPLSFAGESCGHSEKHCTQGRCIVWTCQNGWLVPDVGKDVSYIASPCPVCGKGKAKKGVRQLSGDNADSRAMQQHINARRNLQMKATGATRRRR